MPSDRVAATPPPDAASAEIGDASKTPDSAGRGEGKKSLRDFDYFAAEPRASRPDSGAAALLLQNQEEKRREERRWLRRRIVQTVLSLAAIVAWGVLVWGYRYWMSYALRPETAPLRLGDVTTLTPRMIPHNAFVSIEGITAHRGVSQKSTRGLSLDRREWWFIELIGAQGVFIQVPDDPQRFGAFTEVKVQGRAVDPSREACCDAVFSVYADNYRPLDGQSLRVIQVEARPGAQRLRYVGLLLIWFILTTSFLFTLLRLVRDYRHFVGPRTL